MTVKVYNSTARRVYGWGFGRDDRFQQGRIYSGQPYAVGSVPFTQVISSNNAAWAVEYSTNNLWFWGLSAGSWPSNFNLLPRKVSTGQYLKIAPMFSSTGSTMNLFAIDKTNTTRGKLYYTTASSVDGSGNAIFTQLGSSTNWSDVAGDRSEFIGIDNGVLYTFTTVSSPSFTVKFSTKSNWKQVVSFIDSNTVNFLGVDTAGNLYQFTSATTTLPSALLTGVDRICEIGRTATNRGVIKTNGDLYAWGTNSNGELGLGDQSARTSPTFSRANVKNCAFFQLHSLLVTTSDQTYHAGSRVDSALPDNQYFSSASPNVSWTQLTIAGTAPDKHIAMSVLGFYYLTASTTTPNLYSYWNFATGNFTVGKSGLYYNNDPRTSGAGNTFENYNTYNIKPAVPTELGNSVFDAAEWLSVDGNTASANIIWAVKNTGELYTWGRNNNGAGLTGNTHWISTPTKYGSDTNWALARYPYLLKTNGNLYKYNTSTKVLDQISGTYGDLPASVKVLEVYSETAVVKYDGTAWYSKTTIFDTQIKTMPANTYDTDWDSLIHDTSNSVILLRKTDGSLWKVNTSTQEATLYDSSNWNILSVSGSFSGIKSDGTLWLFDGTTAPTQVGSATNWADVRGGTNSSSNFMVAINSIGEVYSIGQAYYNGFTTAKSALTKITSVPYGKKLLNHPQTTDIINFNSFVGYSKPTSASFSLSTISANTVELTNTTTDATNYVVDWGDGSTTTIANNTVSGAPGITPKLTHTYAGHVSDTRFTVTLTAYSGSDYSVSGTQYAFVYVTQSPSFTVVQQGTGPTVTLLNTTANTLGATSIFGSGNKWRWDWGDGTYTDVDSGSGLPGDRNVNITHLFTFTGPEIIAAVPVNRTVTLKAYNGDPGSPFSSAATTVSVVPVNPTFPNVDYTVDTSVTDIFNAPGGIIWGEPS